MNRLITTLVQLGIGIPALYMGRIVLREVIQDAKDMWHESH
jgi:hypothetical protein